MRLEGHYSFDAPREVVWKAISDPAQTAALIPGVQSFEVTDERHFRAEVKIPLGVGALAMTVEFEKLEEREPEYSSLVAFGRGLGATLRMETSFTLEPEGQGTRMLWTAELSIAGPLGAMGERALQPIFRQQVDRVLAGLERTVDKGES